MIYTAWLTGENLIEVEANGPGEAAVKAAEFDFHERSGFERENSQAWEVEDSAGHRWWVELERQQVPVFFVTACRVAEAT